MTYRARSGRNCALALAAAATAALACATVARAHAHVSPPIVKAEEGQVFSLAVPTEKDGATTTRVELTPPDGFSIDAFVPAAGWRRQVQQTGTGEDAVIRKVIWIGGTVPTGEVAFFQFLGRTEKAASYRFDVRQTYSDGSIVDWAGPESSDTPAPTIEGVASLAGGGRSTLEIVALVVAGAALLLALVALFVGGTRRPVA